MENRLPSLKAKIFYLENEFMEIQIPETYEKLRDALEKNVGVNIPKFIKLDFMDDFGNLVTLDQNSYNDFLEMTNGLCYYIECSDSRLKDSQNKIIAKPWRCNNCFTQNEANASTCKNCSRPAPNPR
jgi:hypothetical protein